MGAKVLETRARFTAVSVVYVGDNSRFVIRENLESLEKGVLGIEVERKVRKRSMQGFK